MSVIGDIVKQGLTGLVKGVGESVHEFVTTDKDRIELEAKITAEANRHIEVISSQVQAAEDSLLRDVQDARAANVKIQEAVNASWFSKNIAYLIDGFVTLIWGAITIYVLARFFKLVDGGQNAPDMSNIVGIYAAVSTQFGIILNFHRGTSKSSQVKDETIKNYLSGGSK